MKISFSVCAIALLSVALFTLSSCVIPSPLYDGGYSGNDHHGSSHYDGGHYDYGHHDSSHYDGGHYDYDHHDGGYHY